MLSLIVSIDSGKVWWKIVPKLELMVGGAKMSRKLWAVSCELRECHESRGWGCLFLVARDSNLETKKAPTMSRLIFERVLKWCGKNIIWCTAVKGRVHETPFWVHERVESCKLRATSCEKREANLMLDDSLDFMNSISFGGEAVDSRCLWKLNINLFIDSNLLED